MPTSESDPLSALRDIHLPPEPGLWPPAPGWWMLALVLMLLVVALVWWRRSVARRRRPQREALRALAGLRDALAGGEAPHRIASEGATLLRRFALAEFPRREVAGLSGSPWLEFLAAKEGASGLDADQAKVLLTAPYAPRTEADEAERVIRLCEQWIRNSR